MRRLYVTHDAVYRQHKNGFSKDLTTYWMGLVDNTQPGWKEAWEAAGKPIVITTEMSEAQQDVWENHPAVTVLPHPTYQGWIKMAGVMDQPENTANTINGVTLLTTPANIGVLTTHTVPDVHKQLQRFHSMFRLRMGAK